MFARALSCLILAGCAPLATPPGAPPAPAPTETPYYLEYSFGALPGWERAAAGGEVAWWYRAALADAVVQAEHRSTDLESGD